MRPRLALWAAVALAALFLAGCDATAPAASVGDHGAAIASWYGGVGERLSAHTASGERFNPADRTAAHRTLPFGSLVEVTYRGHSTTVRINDRGPAAYTGRSLDLSRAAAADIGLIAAGAGPVTIRVIREGP